MKYFDTKKDSLEEAISKAINEKPKQLKEEVIAKDLLEAGGKYLKYSDLLLQKGRLMQQKKNTAMIDKEISKEMKKLGIKEGSDEYEKFFQSALKKFKVDSPADFKTDDKKKEFFNYIDKNYKAKEEESDLEETTTKNVDETLDRIREANVQKGRTMRNILADIWNMGEGKNVFAKDEKVKKEEDEDKKSSKTMTGQKPTKVEIEPEVK